MPDRDTEQQGHSARLLRALIWAGVGLAPVAAVVVLLGGSPNSVRFAVLLIAVCVVLIGASMLIRSDPVLLRMDVEDRVAAEVDALREELRDEIAAAARATHHRVQALQDGLGQARPMASVPAPLAAAAPMGASRPEPGVTTGGRAVVPSASMGPQARPAAGPAAAGAAAVAQPGNAGGPVPRQRGAAVVRPPMAPVFRPPMGPRSGPPSSGPPMPMPAPGSAGPVRRPGPPPGGAYGSPRRPEPDPGYANGHHPEAAPGFDAPGYDAPGYDGPGYDAPGYDGSGYDVPGYDAPGYDAAGYDDAAGYGPAGYGSRPGPRGETGTTGGTGQTRGTGELDDPRQHSPAPSTPESSGKRRADVTAVDLGYTGRRSRANHATTDDDYGPDENTGYTGYGAPSPDQYGPDPMAEQYDWRQPSDRW